MNGWIKIHRKLLDNPIVAKDSDYLSVWIYMLLNASHEGYPALFNGEKILLQPGQLITGRIAISSKLNIQESKVKRILIAFENDQQIERVRSNKNSLITILNWSKYQSSDQQNDQPMTNERPASDRQVTTNKNEENVTEGKEGKEDKNKIIVQEACALFENLWKIYPLKRGKGQVSNSAKKRLLDIGYDQLARAVDRYKADLEKETWRKPQNGSTFFNSGYEDYLDCNYADELTGITHSESQGGKKWQ